MSTSRTPGWTTAELAPLRGRARPPLCAEDAHPVDGLDNVALASGDFVPCGAREGGVDIAYLQRVSVVSFRPMTPSASRQNGHRLPSPNEGSCVRRRACSGE